MHRIRSQLDSARRSLIASSAALAALAICAPGANASVLWTLNDFVFDDGAFAMGSFVWDETTNIVTSWNIMTTDGSRSGVTYKVGTGSIIYFPSFGQIVFEEGSNHFRIGLADFDLLDTPVANLGLFSQNVNQSGPNGFLECTNCLDTRFGEPGAYLSAVVPEPTSASLLVLGLVGLMVRRRRRAR